MIDASLLDLLEAGVWERSGRKQGSEVLFLCPAHDDHHPSARWNRAKLVWFCDVCGKGGGARQLAILLGLVSTESLSAGLSIAELADAKGLSVSFLRTAGVREGINGNERIKCVDIPYLNEAGEIVAVRKRLSLETQPRFAWRRGDKTLPYGLWRLEAARTVGWVVLVEGETDTLTLWHAELPALGLPGAGTWKEAYRGLLSGFDAVYVWREPDRGGDGLTASVAADLPDVRVIDAPIGIKDPNALWLSLGCVVEVFRERFESLVASARPASEMRAQALGAEARDLYAQARSLLEDPDLLERIREAITATGFAGDTNPPMLAYICLTSRLLERPMNLAIIAPSAAGKNRAVDAARDLVPPEAYYLEKAGSARALIYAAEDFTHKIVVIAEADSIPEDGPAASAIRSLVTDNVMEYDVVEKNPESGQFETRRVTKPGPTGLITTFTRSLPEQMSTRMLTSSVADSQEQTRAVLLAHAASVNGEAEAHDTQAFLALQRWLAIAGDRTVTIPFASALAQLVPTLHLRIRRDFRQVLTVIQAIALLLQRQRARDSKGRIVATMGDYAAARELLLDVFTAAATGGITKQVRETVLALRALHEETRGPVTIKALGERIGISRDTAWHRVHRATELGLITNEETRKGQPAKLVPGDPLPEEAPALPTVEELQAYMCVKQPEEGSTVQPGQPEGIEGESNVAVESMVETDVQPQFQPHLLADLNGRHQDFEPPVERLNGSLRDEYTTDDSEADQVYCMALARELGFPVLEIATAVTVNGGEESWRKFTSKATAARLKEALRALESLADAIERGEPT